MPSLGFLVDHPRTQAAYANPKNWPMSLLMEGVPYQAPPPDYLCPGIPPAALDQDGTPECVAFSGVHIKTIQEKVDQGGWYYDTPSAHLAYQRLKNGWGSFPGDGIPDAPGSYPQAFWEMARKEGVQDRNGKVWKISAWYSHDFRTMADLEFAQQAMMAFGPLSIGAPWPAAWFNPPIGPNYIMPLPTGGMAGGHAYTIIGWKTIGGLVHLTCMNSWGFWGSSQGIFRFPAAWLFAAPLGPQVIHKVVDIDDAPTPTPPGGDTVKAYDAIPRTIDVRLGAQFYQSDGVTPLVKLTSGGNDLYSPCKWDASNFNVRISTGGVAQLAVVRASDCSDIRPMAADCVAAVAAERKRWTDWVATAPK